MKRRGFFTAVAAAFASPIATVLPKDEPVKATTELFRECTFKNDGVYVPRGKTPMFHNCIFYQSPKGVEQGLWALEFQAEEK